MVERVSTELRRFSESFKEAIEQHEHADAVAEDQGNLSDHELHDILHAELPVKIDAVIEHAEKISNGDEAKASEDLIKAFETMDKDLAQLKNEDELTEETKIDLYSSVKGTVESVYQAVLHPFGTGEE